MGHLAWLSKTRDSGSRGCEFKSHVGCRDFKNGIFFKNNTHYNFCTATCLVASLSSALLLSSKQAQERAGFFIRLIFS